MYPVEMARDVRTLRAMRVLVIANAGSGRRGALAVARRVLAALATRGHEVRELMVGGADAARVSREAFAWAGSAGAAVLVGGDGTVHHALGAAVEFGVAVYHVPCGNENLFAREFGMRREPERVVEAIERVEAGDAGGDRAIDLGAWRGEMVDESGEMKTRAGVFAIMLSVGPDAGVIERLDAAPRRFGGKAAYVGPVLRALWRPTIPRLRVVVDGQEWLAGERGMLVVANMRQYALRIDPARGACADDGVLDAAFVPCTNSAAWIGAMARGLGEALAGERDGRDAVWTRGTRGKRIEIESLDGPTPVQVDGEGAGRASRIQIEVRERILRVLATV